MSIEAVMPSNRLILCHPLLLLPSSGSFPISRIFPSGGQSIGVSASASVLPMNIEDWFPLDGLVWSPCSLKDSQESSPTPQFKSINSSVLSFFFFNWMIIALQNFVVLCQTSTWWSNSHIHTQLLENHSFDYTDLCRQGNVSAFWYAVYVCHSFSSKEQFF